LVPALAAESIVRPPAEQSGCLGARKSEAPKNLVGQFVHEIPVVDLNPIPRVATKGGSTYENIHLEKDNVEVHRKVYPSCY
jgi:hypothetical protein